VLRPQLDIDFEKMVGYEDMAQVLPPLLLKLFKRSDVDLTDDDEVERMNRGNDLAYIDDWCELEGPLVFERAEVAEGAKEKRQGQGKAVVMTYW
jgi:hypothetical protein